MVIAWENKWHFHIDALTSSIVQCFDHVQFWTDALWSYTFFEVVPAGSDLTPQVASGFGGCGVVWRPESCWVVSRPAKHLLRCMEIRWSPSPSSSPFTTRSDRWNQTQGWGQSLKRRRCSSPIRNRCWEKDGTSAYMQTYNDSYQITQDSISSKDERCRLKFNYPKLFRFLLYQSFPNLSRLKRFDLYLLGVMVSRNRRWEWSGRWCLSSSSCKNLLASSEIRCCT